MKYKSLRLGLGLWLAFLAGTAAGQSRESPEKLFLAWADLKNPVLALPDRAVKDQAVVYDQGWFYFFVSNRFEANDAETFRQNMSFYRTRDFKSYESFFDPNLIVSDQDRLGFPESPDVTRVAGAWQMVFQSRFPDREHYRLYSSTSQDLVHWTPAREIAPQNRPAERQIDGALAEEGGYFFLGYKGQQKFFVTRSVGPALDGRWLPAVRASAGGRIIVFSRPPAYFNIRIKKPDGRSSKKS